MKQAQYLKKKAKWKKQWRKTYKGPKYSLTQLKAKQAINN
jgi:hypothetical protein